MTSGGKFAKAHECLNYYKKLYQGRYGRKPVVNANTAKWGMMDAIGEIGVAGVKQALDYFFLTGMSGHTLQQFFSSYDKITLEIERKARDEEHRRLLRQQTQERLMNEYER